MAYDTEWSQEYLNCKVDGTEEILYLLQYRTNAGQYRVLESKDPQEILDCTTILNKHSAYYDLSYRVGGLE